MLSDILYAELSAGMGTGLHHFTILFSAAAAAFFSVQPRIGAALFFFSDGLIFRQLLFPDRPRCDLPIMITYYLAQLLLGSACLL
jgi:hypothetical protein